MADKKISELDAITGAATAADDFFIVVDSSGSATKKISREELNNAIERDVLSTVDIDGGTIDGTTIGGSSAAAGTFTDLTVTGTVTGISTGISNVVEDTTPQLGGDLDLNGNDITGAGNINNTGTITTDGLTVDAGGSRSYFNSSHVRLSDNYNLEWGGGTNYVRGSNASNYLLFATNSSEAMRIDSSGRVGIGTTGPTAGADVRSAHTGTNFYGQAFLASTDSQAANKGGVLSLGGSYTGTTPTFFGAIGGFKENSTDGNYAGYLTFATRPNGGNSVERLRISSSGDVGIGTSSPISDTNYANLTLNGSSGGQIHFADDDVKKATIASSANDLYVQSGSQTIFRNGGFTSGDEAMRLDSSGRVGIGTSSPSRSLHMKGSAPAVRFEDTDQSGVYHEIIENSGQLDIRADHGNTSTTGNMLFQTGGSEAMRVDSSGRVGIGGVPTTRNVEIIDTNPTLAILSDTTTGASQLLFGDSADDNVGRLFYDHTNDFMRFDTGASEAARIDSSGNVLVGTTSTVTAGSEGVEIRGNLGFIKTARNTTSAAGHMLFYNPNGNVGSITTTGSSTAYNTSSDYRLKENVTADWDATTRLKQLNPVRFNFIADPDTTVDGFLAHEVQDIVPEAISGTKDEVDEDGNAVMQGIDQSKLVPLLVKTIQELEARIAALEAN